MKERPINLKAWEVRAIREGRKTQFRRAVKGAEKETWQGCKCGIMDPCTYWNIGGRAYRCPYGRPGDRLWVRETWAPCGDGVIYRADAKSELGAAVAREHDSDTGRWHPSIHMPRWASRITLEVVGVRVERLNEISEEDAIAEGASATLSPLDSVRLGAIGTHREGFSQVWEADNGPGSWGESPWVWVVEFRRA